jgi:acylpyruvate hydrolase
MRLATVRVNGQTSAAVVAHDALSLIAPYADVGALLRDGDRGLEAAHHAASAGEFRPLLERDLLRPILEPGAIVCVGLNYRSHILEMGRELPEHPTLFSKLPRALTDPFAEIELPAASHKVDWEAELAIVIGTGGRDIAPEQAWSHVAGLTVLNDVTMRDYQRRTIQWFAGKTFQASTPMGPWIVTPDELGDLTSRVLELTLNGERRQAALLGDLVFDVPALVSDLSTIVDLEPGDVIATGTPGGVGEPDGRFIGEGDVVEVGIDGIGTIRNTFRRAAA